MVHMVKYKLTQSFKTKIQDISKGLLTEEHGAVLSFLILSDDVLE